MAYTYPQTPVLSKIKIGNDVKYLKDADVRAILDTFNNAVVTNEIGTVDGNDGKFVTAANIKAYVDQAVAVGIQIVVDTQAQGKEEPATPASATTLGKLYFVELTGTTSGTYTEFITLDKGAEANPRYVWEKIGTTDVDLSDYYTKTEIDTKLALKEDKANLKALAYKDNASGTLTVVTGGSIEYNDVTSASVDIPTYSASEKFIGIAPSETSITVSYVESVDYNALVVDEAGGVSDGTAATFTQGTDTFTAATVSASFLNQGSFPILSAAQTATFATSGIVADVDSQDPEMLVFTAASTNTAVTAQGTLSGGVLPTLNLSAFNGGTFTQGTDSFTPNVPTSVTLTTFTNETITVIQDTNEINIPDGYELDEESEQSSYNVSVVSGISEGTPVATSISITATPTTATLSVTTDTKTVTVQ